MSEIRSIICTMGDIQSPLVVQFGTSPPLLGRGNDFVERTLLNFSTVRSLVFGGAYWTFVMYSPTLELTVLKFSTVRPCKSRFSTVRPPPLLEGEQNQGGVLHGNTTPVRRGGRNWQSGVVAGTGSPAWWPELAVRRGGRNWQ